MNGKIFFYQTILGMLIRHFQETDMKEISWQNSICSHKVISPNSWTLWLHDASTHSFDWHHNQITRFLALVFTDFLTLCGCWAMQPKTIFYSQNKMAKGSFINCINHFWPFTDLFSIDFNLSMHSSTFHVFCCESVFIWRPEGHCKL